MLNDRASGILLHPTSFPSHGGIGDLGPAAYEFVEWLAAGKQSLWQVLPLAPAGIGNSPYSATSAFAGNTLLISLDRLADRGLISRERVRSLPDGRGPVDFQRAAINKVPLLREAAVGFLRSASGVDRERFDKFAWENGWWLEDFVLFDALRQRFKNESWIRWPGELVRREPEGMEKIRAELKDELAIRRYLQYAFFEQWRALHSRCRESGIRIVGDVAIFVSYDSADVWTNPHIFQLRADLEPEFVAGVPPDAFSSTGQRWGNPLYRWDTLREQGYDWWERRMRWALYTCDIIRLDHFRGFEQYWEIPASEPTAVNGKWVDGPKSDLFNVLQQRLGDLPFIAEDLGVITAEVNALRERHKMPGMRVLQFGFGDPGAHIYLPHRYEKNTVVYTGTHDNDTTIGWWKSISEGERAHVSSYLGTAEDGIHWAMIRAAEGSIANLCVVPLQDVLGLDTASRMNIPSRAEGNWSWRYDRGALTSQLAEKLALLAEVSDRLPKPEPHSHNDDHFGA